MSIEFTDWEKAQIVGSFSKDKIALVLSKKVNHIIKHFDIIVSKLSDRPQLLVDYGRQRRFPISLNLSRGSVHVLDILKVPSSSQGSTGMFLRPPCPLILNRIDDDNK
jgi:hypothetical protein